MLLALAAWEDHPRDLPLLDAAPDAFVCDQGEGGGCSPLIQTGCDQGTSCTSLLVLGDPQRGFNDCKPEGTRALGESCAISEGACFGFDDCVPGAACADVICRAICDINGNTASPCVGAEVCTALDAWFVLGTTRIAGVCR